MDRCGGQQIVDLGGPTKCNGQRNGPEHGPYHGVGEQREEFREERFAESDEAIVVQPKKEMITKTVFDIGASTSGGIE